MHRDFQRRHMAAIATILRRAKLRPNDSVTECLDDLERDFADMLAKANPKFKPGRFHQACDPCAEGGTILPNKSYSIEHGHGVNVIVRRAQP